MLVVTNDAYIILERSLLSCQKFRLTRQNISNIFLSLQNMYVIVGERRDKK